MSGRHPVDATAGIVAGADAANALADTGASGRLATCGLPDGRAGTVTAGLGLAGVGNPASPDACEVDALRRGSCARGDRGANGTGGAVAVSAALVDAAAVWGRGDGGGLGDRLPAGLHRADRLRSCANREWPRSGSRATGANASRACTESMCGSQSAGTRVRAQRRRRTHASQAAERVGPSKGSMGKSRA